eukprot:6659457-Ditylum_brightwellii.AAC.1
MLKHEFGKFRGPINSHLVSISVAGDDTVARRCGDIFADLVDKIVKAVDDLDNLIESVYDKELYGGSPLGDVSKYYLCARDKCCMKVCHGQEMFNKFKKKMDDAEGEVVRKL